jgi:hypothetical protein
MSSDYEKTLEEENERLHAELEQLRSLLFNIAPHLDGVFDSLIKDVNAINNGYFERGHGCLQLLKKIKKEKEYIQKELASK